MSPEPRFKAQGTRPVGACLLERVLSQGSRYSARGDRPVAGLLERLGVSPQGSPPGIGGMVQDSLVLGYILQTSRLSALAHACLLENASVDLAAFDGGHERFTFGYLRAVCGVVLAVGWVGGLFRARIRLDLGIGGDIAVDHEEDGQGTDNRHGTVLSVWG